MHYSGYSDTQVLRRVYENAAPEYKLYRRHPPGDNRIPVWHRAEGPQSVPGPRSVAAARAPAVGVLAHFSPEGDAANQMMTQSAGSGLNSRRACHRSGSGRRQYSRDPAVKSPVVEGGRIVVNLEADDGSAMTATLDTATRSFISEDCVAEVGDSGKTQIVQTRIRLADGSTLEVGS
ncbi:hypothetical protein ACLKA7_007792 [Drosophila subpalustris]